MVDWLSLDLLLYLHDRLLLPRYMGDSLGTMAGKDAGDLVEEDTAEADGAAPRVAAVYAASDALGAIGEAALVYLWRKRTYGNVSCGRRVRIPSSRGDNETRTFGGFDDLEGGETIPPQLGAGRGVLRGVGRRGRRGLHAGKTSR